MLGTGPDRHTQKNTRDWSFLTLDEICIYCFCFGTPSFSMKLHFLRISKITQKLHLLVCSMLPWGYKEHTFLHKHRLGFFIFTKDKENSKFRSFDHICTFFSPWSEVRIMMLISESESSESKLVNLYVELHCIFPNLEVHFDWCKKEQWSTVWSLDPSFKHLTTVTKWTYIQIAQRASQSLSVFFCSTYYMLLFNNKGQIILQ